MSPKILFSLFLLLLLIIPASATVVGVEWNHSSSSPTLRRIDLTNTTIAAPNFDTTYPWSGMGRINESWTQYQTLVKIPAFYYATSNETVDGSWVTRYYISDTNTSGFKLHPMFINNNVAKNASYISAFEGSVYNVSTSSYNLGDFAGVTTGDKLSSIPGSKPVSGRNNTALTIPAFRTLAQNRGSGWEMQTFQQVSAVELLFITEYATLNSQSVFRGVVDINDVAAGNTNNNAINTGFTAGYGTNSSNLYNASGAIVTTHYATGQTTYPFSYRGIENFYGNIGKWGDGINIKADRNPWVADNGYQSDLFSAPYVNTGFTLSSSDGYGVTIVYSTTTDYAFLPITVGGSDSTYLADTYYRATGNRAALFGGRWDYAATAGAFAWIMNSDVSTASRSIGTRLAYFPPSAPLSTPISSFTANTTGGLEPIAVQFTDTSTSIGTDIPTSWQWNVTNVKGNNTAYTISTSQNPVAIFPYGNYSITLNASNLYGGVISTQNTWVNVTSGTPSYADFTANVTGGILPFAVQFTDTSNNTPIYWNWDFGDGDTSLVQNPEHLYTSGGNFTVTLAVYNVNLTTTYKSDTIYVYNLTSKFTQSASTGTTPLSVTFTDTTTGYPAATSWNWTARNVTGNNTPVEFSTSQSPTATFRVGNFSIQHTATSPVTENTSTQTSWVNVSPMVASFVGSPLSGTVPFTVSFSGASTGTPTAWSWNFGDGNTSTDRDTNNTYYEPGVYTVSLTATNGGDSDTETKVGYITAAATSTTDLYMDPLPFTLTLTFTDSATGAVIPVVGITDNLGYTTSTTVGIYSRAYNVSNMSSPVVYLTVSSDGYTTRQLTYEMTEDITETVTLTAVSTPNQITNVIYQAQLYRFIFQNLIGTPLGGLQVTITPLDLTIQSNWTTLLIGIPEAVDIQNGIISGTTGSDGSFGTPLLTPLGYQVNITGTAHSGDIVDYSITEYPPSQGTDIIISLPTSVTGFIRITPTPAFITYNIFNETVTNTTQILSVNFNDPTGDTNLTIVSVRNQSGYVLNTTTYTGAAAADITNNFTYVEGVTSPPGDMISYGLYAYVPSAGGWNNITESYDTNRGTSLTGHSNYDGWAAIIIIVLVSSAFTASTVYIGTIAVGLMGLAFYATVKWFTPGVQGTVFMTMCIFWICIGIIGFIMKKSRGGF